MANMLKTGLSWLEQTLKASCSDLVEYQQGETKKCVDAIAGKTDVGVGEDSGIRVQSYIWDFLIDVTALGLTPERGDIITSDGVRYEVTNLGDERCWRYTSPTRETYRIHTQEVV